MLGIYKIQGCIIGIGTIILIKEHQPNSFSEWLGQRSGFKVYTVGAERLAVPSPNLGRQQDPERKQRA